jgi:hypothetical protein
MEVERPTILNARRAVNHHLPDRLHLTSCNFVDKRIGVFMVRWVTFDDQTAAALATTVASGTAEIRDGDALETALEMGDCTLILPADVPGQVLFLQMRMNFSPAASKDETIRVESGGVNVDEPSEQYEATGFLGLTDSAVYEDQPATPKKWWQKLLD